MNRLRITHLHTPRAARRLGLLALVATMTLVVGLGSPAAVQAGPANAQSAALAGSTTVSVLDYNIQGGGTPNFGQDSALQPVLNYLAAGNRPDIITLQEVCASQSSAAWNNFGAYGYWTWFRKIKDQNNCLGADKSYGEAISVRQTNPFDTTLIGVPFTNQQPGSSAGLTCATFTKGTQIRFCSTHLPVETSPVNYAKLGVQDIDNKVQNWTAQGLAVIVAGDFNNKPTDNAMTGMYAIGGGTGRHNEVCQTRTSPPSRSGPATTNDNPRKIDYIFASKNMTSSTSGLSCAVHSSTIGGVDQSSHKMLSGSITLSW